MLPNVFVPCFVFATYIEICVFVCVDVCDVVELCICLKYVVHLKLLPILVLFDFICWLKLPIFTCFLFVALLSLPRCTFDLLRCDYHHQTFYVFCLRLSLPTSTFEILLFTNSCMFEFVFATICLAIVVVFVAPLSSASICQCLSSCICLLCEHLISYVYIISKHFSLSLLPAEYCLASSKMLSSQQSAASCQCQSPACGHKSMTVNVSGSRGWRQMRKPLTIHIYTLHI